MSIKYVLFSLTLHQLEKESPGVHLLASDQGRLVTADKEKAEMILNNFLPQSLLATALHTALKQMVQKMRTGGALPLQL